MEHKSTEILLVVAIERRLDLEIYSRYLKTPEKV